MKSDESDLPSLFSFCSLFGAIHHSSHDTAMTLATGTLALQAREKNPTPYRFLPFLFVYNNLGHLLFARKLTPMTKTGGALTQF